MAGNPLVPLGTINKLLASVTWNDIAALNVTASYLAEPIRYRYDGPAVDYHPVLAGAVPSPNPYQMITVVIPLVRSQTLADQYKQRMEANALIGDGTVRPDTKTLSPFNVINCSIENVDEINLGGGSAVFGAVIKGYTLANSDLWNL